MNPLPKHLRIRPRFDAKHKSTSRQKRPALPLTLAERAGITRHDGRMHPKCAHLPTTDAVLMADAKNRKWA